METKAKTTKTTKTTKKLLTEKTTKTFNRNKYMQIKLAYFVTNLRNDRVQYLYDNNRYTELKKVKYQDMLKALDNLKPTPKKQLEDAMSLILDIASLTNSELTTLVNRNKE